MITAIIAGLVGFLGLWYFLDRCERHDQESYLFQEMKELEKFQRVFNKGDN